MNLILLHAFEESASARVQLAHPTFGRPTIPHLRDVPTLPSSWGAASTSFPFFLLMIVETAIDRTTQQAKLFFPVIR